MKVEPTDVVLAAGALVWRVRKGELQVLAVHRPRYDDWSWPKGKLDLGETLPACAVREVAEETGKVIELGQPLPTLRYPIGGGKVKIVRYWAAHVISPDTPAAIAREAVKEASKNEIDSVKWLTIE
ncbi:NUDIX hydrolase, partial [Demequina sp. TTPB684]|nr:NUDIX hydrolase [Demequina sp. TTPB684]